MPNGNLPLEPSKLEVCRPRSCPSCWDGMWLLESSQTFQLCSAPCREGTSTHVSHRRELEEDCQPCPSIRESTVSLPLSPGPMWPSRGCVPTRGPLCLRLGLSPCQRLPVTARVSLVPNRDSETKCVSWLLCASLSYFNTRFIHGVVRSSVRRYFLND